MHMSSSSPSSDQAPGAPNTIQETGAFIKLQADLHYNIITSPPSLTTGEMLFEHMQVLVGNKGN